MDTRFEKYVQFPRECSSNKWIAEQHLRADCPAVEAGVRRMAHHAVSDTTHLYTPERTSSWSSRFITATRWLKFDPECTIASVRIDCPAAINSVPTVQSTGLFFSRGAMYSSIRNSVIPAACATRYSEPFWSRNAGEQVTHSRHTSATGCSVQ